MRALRRHAALAAVLIASATPAWAGGGFAPGETVEFTIDYLGIKMGDARIVVGQAEGPVWPIIAQGRSGGLASIVDIREHFVSYWDSEARIPRGSDLRALEIGDRHDDSARFDRDNGKATIRITRKGKREEKTYPLDPSSQDFASSIFWLRTQPLAEDARFDIPVFTTKGTFILQAAVVGRERVESRAGVFDCWKVQVRTAFEGHFEAKRDTFIWFSADENKVPVRVSAEFAVGSVVVNLASYQPGGQLARN
ncbi:MAG TPA: DUF3108 domain-containing protein [Anaeromyxobacteraceae bacterium]|nr:DUF3108 domain-containing protein [Anaeromyxobacteraceae bacterium]